MGQKLEALLVEVRAKYPRYALKRRSDSILTSWWGRGFATTLGDATYAQDGFEDWDDADQWKMIRHEATHVEQSRTWPLGPKVPGLNRVVYALCYLFLLPLFWTLRSRIEGEAYLETTIAEHALGRLETEAQRQAHVEWLVGLFSGPAYLWMQFESPARRRAQKMVDDVVSERIKSRWVN